MKKCHGLKVGKDTTCMKLGGQKESERNQKMIKFDGVQNEGAALRQQIRI